MSVNESPDRLVLGFDFGTTFSGLAYSYSASPDKPDEINIIRTWPGGNAYTSDKVPSELAYGPSESLSRATSTASRRRSQLRSTSSAGSNGSRYPNERSLADVFNLTTLSASLDNSNGNRSTSQDQIRWGFMLRADETRLRCLKLLLDSNQQLPSYISESDMKEQLRRCGKDAVTAVSDYLTELFNHAKETLIRRYGEYFIKTTHIEVVLTVPAIWSDDAKDATLRAARKAGMGADIRMISEPEAAAVYTLQAIQPNHLHVGDNFVVVDAGGGTVDLISYEIGRKSPLRIEETVRGTGACCGAAFLNIRFEEYVKQKLGDATFRSILDRQPRSWLAAMRYFEEYVKRNFSATDSIEYNIPFPGVPDNVDAGISQGFLTMSSDAVGSLFRPIIGDIVQLVEEQVQRLREKRKLVKAIVLVGGFGQSNCLFQCLQAQFSNPDAPPPYSDKSSSSPLPSNRSENGIEIMQPTNAWTAVARGAVLRGLEGTEIVLSRKSRRHYGIEFRRPFKFGVHRPQDKVWSDHEQSWKADCQMRWYIRKNQDCLSSEAILFPFYNTFWSNQGQSKTVDLIVCDEDLAPAMHDKTTGATKRVCSLVANLDQVPARFWELKTNSEGHTYWKLSYQLGMQVESGGLKVDLRVDDVVYGDVVAEFHSD